MNRKLLTGAVALVLPATMLAVTGAGASPAGLKYAKATVTSVTVSHDSHREFEGVASNQYTPYEGVTTPATNTVANGNATIHIIGTGFNASNGDTSGTTTVSMDALNCKGLVGFATDGLSHAPVLSNVTRVSKTEITAELGGATGNSFFYNKKGNLPCKAQSLTIGIPTVTAPVSAENIIKYSLGGTVVAKKVITMVSNCGVALPTVASAGTTYGVDAFGNLNVGDVTGSNANVDYFDVQINAILGIYNLCAEDIGSTTSVGPVQYAVNYPLTFTGTGSTLSTVKTHLGKIDGIGFSFPYQASTDLAVFGTSVTYAVAGAKSIGNCTAGTQPAGVTFDHCDFGAKQAVVYSTGTTTYSKGDTIESPVINLKLVQAKAATVTVTPTSTASEIGISPSGFTPSCSYVDSAWVSGANTICVAILFAPRPGSANVAYAPLQFAASAS